MSFNIFTLLVVMSIGSTVITPWVLLLTMLYHYPALNVCTLAYLVGLSSAWILWLVWECFFN